MNTTQMQTRLADNELEITKLATRDEALNDDESSRLTELRSERKDLTQKYAAATELAEAERRSAHVELEKAGVTGAARVGDVLSALVEHRSTDGATAEMQAELGLGNNQVPVALLAPVEHRAVTPAPTTGEPVNVQEVLPQIFPMDTAQFLSATMVSVAAGESSHPVFTSTTEASLPATSASVSESDGVFTPNVLVPRRVQASFFWPREDAARFPEMEPSLRMNLSEALGSRVDKAHLDSVLGTTPDGTGTEFTWDLYAQSLSDVVDGYFSNDFSDICLLVNPAVLGDMVATIRSGNASDWTTYHYFMNILKSLMASAHMPGLSTRDSETNQGDLFFRRGMKPASVVCIWDAITLINDEVTKAASGEIVATAVGMFQTATLRSGAFVRKGCKTA